VTAVGVADGRGNPPLRGTQLLVEHMGEVVRRPSLVAIEIAWRWLFGIPFLFFCQRAVQHILAEFPLASSGINSIDVQNPWVAATQLARVFSYYGPHFTAELWRLAPIAALVWVVISGVGRAVLLSRMEKGTGARQRLRVMTIIALQAVWLGLLAITLWAWLRTMEWMAAAHMPAGSEPDLVGYAIWTIFLALGFFTLWAAINWPASVAPIVARMEDRSAISALRASLRLGKAFTGKLVEINLVLGIAKLALFVVAMVFSAAPLPFSDQLGQDSMHAVWAASGIFYLVANDYFQVVRLRAFVEFWKVYRGPGIAEGAGQ
jgi:hypothetical protein